MKLLNNSKTQTIDQFVKNSTESYLQFQNSSYYKVINGEIMEDFNIFRDRYFDTIMQYTEIKVFTDDEHRRYKYRPKRLSAALYSTIDYWYILLMINKMSSILEFDKKKIKILNYGGVAFLKSLAKKEENLIAENKNQVRETLKNYNKVLEYNK